MQLAGKASEDYYNGFVPGKFRETALELYHFQYRNNALYNEFNRLLGIRPDNVKELVNIPFLPISFFKTHRVVTGDWQDAAYIFESSGTTGEIPSRHFIRNPDIYHHSLLGGFRQFYGEPSDYAILALLPSYLERGNSSLVHMAKVLMEHSGHAANGFYLNEWDKLAEMLQHLEEKGQKTLLLGVTFALLDFAAEKPMLLNHTTLMETGGMKGRRAEWTRDQVHAYLEQQLGVEQVHSEYGMTELLSQAYAAESGIFTPASAMKVLVRDIQDPLEVSEAGSGVLNIIDLANVDTCSFIATEDLGKVRPDGRFEVLGRVDHAALRGCSLMAV